MVLIDLLRIPFVLSLLLVQTPDDLWIMYVSTFLLACGEALYAPARMSIIPALVKRERLADINALEQMLMGFVLVVGASAGGIFAFYLGLSLPFWIHALTFLLSALFLLRINEAQSEAQSSSNNSPPASSRTMLFQSSILLTFLFIAVTMPLANGIDNVLMNVYALDVFQMGELGIGFMYAALGIGFIVSSFFSKYLKRGFLLLTVVFAFFLFSFTRCDVHYVCWWIK